MRNGKSGTGYMELNTINKTGTWSETADRINSNFSKISIEVEEIKQNGGGGSGGGTMILLHEDFVAPVLGEEEISSYLYDSNELSEILNSEVWTEMN
jgi:hypothetical protein